MLVEGLSDTSPVYCSMEANHKLKKGIHWLDPAVRLAAEIIIATCLQWPLQTYCLTSTAAKACSLDYSSSIIYLYMCFVQSEPTDIAVGTKLHRGKR